MAGSTCAALAQEIACSELRPPNTTATLILPCSFTLSSAPLLARLDQARSGTAQRVQGHVRVGDEILSVLESDGEPYRARVDPRTLQRPRIQLPVRGRRRVADLGVRAAQGRGDPRDPPP